ncbi:hypothetical protein LIT25_19190 [Bacillus sp. F19]|nr:hypothetical protein LIT25_19190 [Bacillus sp. F19]
MRSCSPFYGPPALYPYPYPYAPYTGFGCWYAFIVVLLILLLVLGGGYYYNNYCK